MNKRLTELRRAAEAHLAAGRGAVPAPPQLDRDTLLHELLVLQTELEMQNDELRSAQLELAQSRDRYRRLYELAPVGYVTMDARGRVMEANPCAAELLGVGDVTAQVVGQALQSFMPQASADRLRGHLAAVFGSGQRQSCDVILTPRNRDDGTRIPVRIESIAGAGSTADGAVCHSAIVNVSEVRTMREQLGLAKVTSGVGLWCWKPANGSSTWDENSRAMLGLQHGETLDGDALWAEFVHPDDRATVAEALRRARAGAPFAARFRIVRRDASEACLVARGSPVRDADGRLVSMTGAFLDVTREELSSELSKIAFEASPSALLITDRDGKIVLANDQAATLFGWEGAELVGASVEALLPPEVRPRHFELRAEFFAAPTRRKLVGRDGLRGVRRDGQEVPLEISLAPVQIAGGPGVLAVIVDLTERREMQAKLSQSERLAAVGELAAGVAHEINNPVNTMINCAQLVLDGDGIDEHCRVIIEEGERITEIVKDLLQFARNDRSKACPVSLVEVLHRTMRLFGESLKRHGIAVRVEAPEDLPPVLAHPQQIQQVLVNLMVNAKDALQQRTSGGDRRIVIRAVAGEQTVRCSVWDNGTGIPAELATRVFEPFVTTKRARGGTGLGLSVSRSIVEAFGGTLQLRSVEGEFCEFEFELLRAPAQ